MYLLLVLPWKHSLYISQKAVIAGKLRPVSVTYHIFLQKVDIYYTLCQKCAFCQKVVLKFNIILWVKYVKFSDMVSMKQTRKNICHYTVSYIRLSQAIVKRRIQTPKVYDMPLGIAKTKRMVI